MCVLSQMSAHAMGRPHIGERTQLATRSNISLKCPKRTSKTPKGTKRGFGCAAQFVRF